ncbi:Spo0E family sporulation regulatory protein-aspartic acid phosphatase [Tumebacillus lipolyticus]|uniref:Spo0E family sporulation regulatory protein-aspartic acid phosphatase n=1 Tax=Tumebacillus lipolyticus TaxID=1280370 RepID=A0ABW4ZXJ5_9BACL
MENENIVLEQTIENLRLEMHRLADQSGNLVDERVIAISQKLDEYLVKFQLKMR